MGFILGPLLFLIIKFGIHFLDLAAPGVGVLATTAWVATWWITEVVEVEVTALLPMILFPLTGGLNLSKTCASYGHKYIFLFLGGFVLAIAIQKWNLHKRIALNIINRIGTRPDRIILGFMVSTAFMSMWISNTATTVMMLPIALAVSSQFEGGKGMSAFTSALLLSIAYSASIGGISTLIGTPPNLILAGVVHEIYNVEITFTMWMVVGVPVSILLLVVCWFYLTRVLRKSEVEMKTGLLSIREELTKLGTISYEEKLIAAVFLLTAAMWVTRSFFIEKFIPEIDDTIIAILAAVILFLMPSRNGNQKLIEWKDAVKLPWGILILFGGGIAIAEGFQQSGLADWIADNLTVLQGLSLFIVLISLVFMVNFLTEITSNLATTSVLLPVLAPLAVALHINPYYLMVGATMAASCAFMLPVATPPNAIVFGSEHLTLKQMMRAGLWMNLISVVVITLFVYFVLPMVWGGMF